MYYTYSNKNNNNNNVSKRLRVIFLITILSCGAITNIYSLSAFSSNFAFLKDVQALETKEYMFEYDKEEQNENNFYKNSHFDNSRYLSSSPESHQSSTKLDFDRNKNYNNNNYDINYNTLANIEREHIECTNVN